MIDDRFKSGKMSPLPEVIPSVVQEILALCNTEKCFEHLDSSPIPSREAVARIIRKARHILFPGYFSQNVLTHTKLQYDLIEEDRTL